MRAIDADALIEILAEMQGRCAKKAALVQNSKIWQQVKAMPTVDAQPIRHGRWTTSALERNSSGVRPYYLYCSECNHSQRHTSKYCPSCGAKMDNEHGKPCDDCQEFDCYGCKYAERKEE